MSRMRAFLYGAAAGILLCSGGKRIAMTGLGIGKRIISFVRESGARIAEEWTDDRPEDLEDVTRKDEARPKAKVSRKKKASRKP